MPITHTDNLLQKSVGATTLVVVPGVWVRLLSNNTATNYYSTAVSDVNGAFTHSAPPDDYSLYYGAAATVPGTPTLANAHYAVPVTAGDDIAMKSASASSISPYTPSTAIRGGEQVTSVSPVNVKSKGCKLDGVTDDTVNYQSALTAAAVGGSGSVAGDSVFQPYGVAIITATLSMVGDGVRLEGVSHFASQLRIPLAASGFTGTTLINVNGATHVVIENLGIQGTSATYSLNAAIDAIDLTNGANGTRLRNLVFFYVNGWLMSITPKGDGTTTFATFLSDIHGRLCKQGLYAKGGSTTFYSVGLSATNVLFDTMLGGDGVLLDDATDCVFGVFQCQLNVGASYPIHIRGRSTACYFAGVDSGGTTAFPNPGVLIEAFGGFSPKYIKFVGGTLSLANPSVSITGGTHISFNGIDLANNDGGGLYVSGTADMVSFVGGSMQLNNTGAHATTYDLSVSVTTANVIVDDTFFDSAGVTKAWSLVAGHKVRMGQCYGTQAGNLGGNQIVIKPASAGANPIIASEGDDTNPFITLQPKGTGGVYVAPLGSNDYLQLVPVTGTAEIDAAGSSAAVVLKLRSKNAFVNMGSSTATGGVYITNDTVGDYAQFVPQAGVFETDAVGSSASIDWKVVPKGSGNFNVGGHVSNTLAGTPVASALGANVTSVTFTGNDRRGTIAIVMSGALARNTRIATCTFAVSYGATSPPVFFFNQTSGNLALVNLFKQAFATGVSFDIASDQALAAGTYTFGYVVEA